MTTDATAGTGTRDGDYRLSLVLDAGSLSVSGVSSTLRAIQAAAREFARGAEGGEALFDGQPQPALLLDVAPAPEGRVMFGLYFADPATGAAMPELSAGAFEALMSGFAGALKRLPQRGLWGRTARSYGPRRFESEAVRRLDELRVEIRRFGRAELGYGERAIRFDGDQMEII